MHGPGPQGIPEARRSLDELHAALDHTRRQAEGRNLQPLLYDLVLLTDRVQRQAEGDDGLAEPIAAELLTLLERYGVARVPVTRGLFDPAAQEAVGTIDALSPEQVGQVAEIVRHGYRMDERVVRPQQVRLGEAVLRASPGTQGPGRATAVRPWPVGRTCRAWLVAHRGPKVPEMPPHPNLTRQGAGQTGCGGIRTSNVPEEASQRGDLPR